MPAEYKVITHKQSSYTNSGLVMTSLTERSVPWKTEYKLLLIPDGQASHCNKFQMLNLQEMMTLCCFGQILTLANICNTLTGHFKDFERGRPYCPDHNSALSVRSG